MAVWVVFDLADSLVWDFAYSSLVTVVPLVIPARTWERLVGRLRPDRDRRERTSAKTAEAPEEVSS